MADLKLVRSLKLIPDTEENNSVAIIGYAFVGVTEFLFGLLIGWLIWG
jgi:hypothetical protein